MARALVYFPSDPFVRPAGCHQRFHQITGYLKRLGYEIDLVSESNNDPAWTADSLKKSKQSFHSATLSPADRRFKFYLREALRGRPLAILKRLFKPRRPDFADHTSFQLLKNWKLALETTKYDLVLVNYAYYYLLGREARVRGVPSILDAHDFLTLNNLEREQNEFLPGRMFDGELQALSDFDKIICISATEHHLFSAMLPKTKFFFVPQSFPSRASTVAEKRYDFLFVGGSNPHNIRGLHFFFDQVRPILPSGLRFCIVGDCGKEFKDIPGVISVGHVENISEYYDASKVSICPLLTGTGMKVKVIEALSHGVPLVSTERGIDGLPVVDETAIQVASSASQFASLLSNLLATPERLNQARIAATGYFDRHFRDEVVFGQFKALVRA